LAAGTFALSIRALMAELYRVPVEWVTLNGTVNLLYAAYSLALAWQSSRPIGAIQFLAVANMLWAVFCVAVLVLVLPKDEHWLARGHLCFEAAFVGGLGVWEWRYQRELAG
jgi:hypothetical protein